LSARSRASPRDTLGSSEDTVYFENVDEGTNVVLSENDGYVGDDIGDDRFHRELAFVGGQHAHLSSTGQRLSAREQVIYDKSRVYADEAEKIEVYEDVGFRKRSPQEQEAHKQKYTEKMALQSKEYEALFNKWKVDPTEGNAWLSYLEIDHKKFVAALPTELSQPNPWAYDVTSRRYYSRVFDVFSGEDTSHGSPTAVVEAACKGCASALGGDSVVTFKMAPLKGLYRTIQKVRSKNGCFDQVYDYGRGMFVVKKAHYFQVPKLIDRIREIKDFAVVRAKNRLSLSYDGRESAGYRDYQLLVRIDHGWLVEIQVIPEEMYEIKQKLGHSDYTQNRFNIEAIDRAAKNAHAQVGEGEYLEFADGAATKKSDGFDKLEM
jgi:hypothetical protein